MTAIRLGRSFRLKAILAVLLVALADWAFWRGGRLGANMGVVCLAVTAAGLMVSPAVRASPRARLFALIALAFAGLQVETVSVLATLLFWAAVMVAMLSPRAGGADNAALWAARLTYAAVGVVWKPFRDPWRAVRRTRIPPGAAPKPLLKILLVPVLGGGVFLGLFAVANPVIAQIAASLTWPALDIWRVTFWVIVFAFIWSVLRPASLPRPSSIGRPAPPRPAALPSGASITLSLIVFNAVFALQNVLDLMFLWSGAKLPAGVTYAGYVHRGAFALIVAALLAGAFVLVALGPASPTARRKGVRVLVVVWVAQTVFLVFSCVLRTADYVQAYLLTPLRLAAFAWMGLVAIGLVLILWRLLAGKSSSWLINANALAAALVLAGCSAVDLDAVAAAWNVRHARDVGGTGEALEICYLQGFGDSALVSLAEMNNRPIDPGLRARAAFAFLAIRAQLQAEQRDWRSWTWRGQRRLQQAQALAAGRTWLLHPASACAPAPLTSASGE